jgi:hypothetical protein
MSADLQAAYDGPSEPFKELAESVSAAYNAYPADGTDNRPPWIDTGRAAGGAHTPPHGRKGPFLISSVIRLTGIGAAEGQALTSNPSVTTCIQTPRTTSGPSRITAR